MANYPTNNVHRRDRRRLGRGQFPSFPTVTGSVTASGATASIAFDMPVVVKGIVPLEVTGKTFVSQQVISSQLIHQTFNTNLAGAAWLMSSPIGNVTGWDGQGVGGGAGTF